MLLHSDLSRAKRVKQESPEARVNRSNSREGCSGREGNYSRPFRKNGTGVAARPPVSFKIELEAVRTGVEK